MSNLHQLLAVKKEAAERSNQIMGETKKVLSSKHYFFGSNKAYKAFDDEDSTNFPEENEQMSYTVGEKLKHFAREFGRSIDIEYQIDMTKDQSADLVAGDFRLEGVPAPFLLDFITFLEKTGKVYASIPVLDPNHQWEIDPTSTPGVFKATDPEVTYRSKKVLRHKVLVDPTEHHPAQVEKWPEDTQVGQYTKRMWSGALTAAQKSTILGRIDRLKEAAKKALSAANNVEHHKGKVAEKIFDFLHDGIPTEGVLHSEDL